MNKVVKHTNVSVLILRIILLLSFRLNCVSGSEIIEILFALPDPQSVFSA